MNVSKDVAQKIVTSMKDIIQQDINFIDKDGIIIASTDPRRVGVFHEAGKKVTESNQMIIIEFDEQYTGARKGINMPVTVNGEVIAAIGITGSVEQVLNYGHIIRKMTEILVLEEELQQLKKSELERQTLILDDLLFYPSEFSLKWDELIQLNWMDASSKRVAIVKIPNQSYLPLKALENRIYQRLHSPSEDKADILFMDKAQSFIFLYKESARDRVKNCFDWIVNKLAQKNIPVIIALGSQVKTDFSQSYIDAGLALDTIPENETGKIYVEFEKLTIELLLGRKNYMRQKLFKERVLANLTPEEAEDYKTIINCFEHHNGAISKIAEDLFIHKNTLQYKIQKLKKLTGYDLRNYKDFMILWLAFRIH